MMKDDLRGTTRDDRLSSNASKYRRAVRDAYPSTDPTTPTTDGVAQ
jgi:hypothetical protein